ncbi:MAG TPA: hypothetical protein DCE23_01905 [Firmicutes bacterium]|nr:hypothetical protein [Bacillota bacterium]
MFDYRTLLYFNVFSFTANTFDQTNLIIRLKTSESSSNNIFITSIPNSFKLVYVIESDGSYTLYTSCNSNEKVKLQLVEGFDGFVEYYYESPFDIELNEENINEPALKNEVFGNKGTCSVQVNSSNTGIIVETPVGGDGFYPIRDGSVSFGKPNRKWKGGHFSEYIQVPIRIELSNIPDDPKNGYTIFQAYLKKLITYYNGKWYSNGEEVKLT